MILRDLATTWVQANCPHVKVQEDFLKHLDNALQSGVGCSFILGHKLTRAAKPYLVYCYCGELFAFELTPRQAARLQVKDGMLMKASGHTLQNHESHPEPLVQLKQVEIDNAAQFDKRVPLGGSLAYRSAQHWALPLAIQVVCQPAGRSMSTFWHHLQDLPHGEVSLRFHLPPLGELPDCQGVPFAGVLPMFVQIGIVGEPEANSQLTPFGTPKKPTFMHPHQTQPQMLPPGPPVQQRLGEHFIPPSPTPTLMTPDSMNFPSRSDVPPLTVQTRYVQRFRAVSDFRAVLVEVE